MLAASYGNVDCLVLLITGGVDVDAKDFGGRTASMQAACYGHADCLSWLIKAGANLDAVDKNGITASMLAAEGGHTDCQRMIEAEIERRELASEFDTPSSIKQRSSLRV